MLKKGTWLLLPLLVVLLVASACSGGQDHDAEGDPDIIGSPINEEQNKEPLKWESSTVVTDTAEISIYMFSMSQPQLEFIQTLAKEKFPNYTIVGVPTGGTNSYANLVASGNMPDIVATRFIQDLKNFGLDTDISDLVRTHQYDLTRLDPAALSFMTNDTNGAIAGLPLNFAVRAMHYNKDVFDRFGVDYPVDGMTWDEVYEASRRLTRVEDGTLYRGYSERWWSIFFEENPFGYTLLSRTEDRATVNSEGWSKLAANWKRFYELPGLEFTAQTIGPEADRAVFEKGTTGMTVFTGAPPAQWNFQWDLASPPVFAEKPGVGSPASVRYMYMTETSKNKEAAFQFMAWLTTDEVQGILAAELGQFPVVNDEEAKRQFLSKDPHYMDKHIGAFYYNQYPEPVPPRRDGLVNVNAHIPFNAEMQKIILEGKDINSALRDAEEAINQLIATQKSQ